ncbi:hypothetical protein ACJMK2_022287 [Sinanodonta woodiana]|uniref:Zinc transporter ZIP10 n=1 Tax=Sinanodonta woodiana TaxID=1069815 RepID=A0ABD3TJJ4_SINWO
MMCISKVPQVCVICLVFSHLLHSINSKHAEHEQTTLPNQKHEKENFNKTFATLNYQLERQKISAEKRQFFISKLFEKYGTGDKLPFEGFEHMLEHIRLGNLSFPDHDLALHKINSSTFFMSLHSDHIHIPALSNQKPCDRVTSASMLSDTDNTESQDTASLSINGNIPDNINKTLVQKSEQQSSHSDARHIHENWSAENKTQNLFQQGEKTRTSQLGSDSFTHHSSEVHYPSNVEHHPSSAQQENNSTNHLHVRQKRDIGEGIFNHHQARKRHGAENDIDENKCFTPQEILKSFNFGSEDEITMSDFVDLCPALIYHLDKKQCLDFTIVMSYEQEGQKRDEEPKQQEVATRNNYQISDIPAKVWGFSCLAVLIVSVVGLLGVAVIPLMNKMFYNHLLNFLVALAVGALTGDALLHLLPHALKTADEGHSHEGKDGHDIGGVLKGLCGLGGIYFFFFMENILTILTEFKRRQKNKKRQAMSTEDTYDGQLKEISAMGEKESMMSIQDTSDTNFSKLSHQKEHHDSKGEETINMIDKSEFSRSHSHSHSHHGDQVPSSVAAIAWMVILGDGMHNLSDGLAIGAAFGAGISSGFSTSIAVFCHELPHEIGDFAMLLKSGMTVKQAIFYNVVSSILSFIGMVIGVMLGNVTSASLWIFAVVAGMFLYIALVDMLPEVKNRAHEGMVGKQLCDLLLQSAGMFVGAGIMLSIALYEDKIQIAFDPV